MKTIHKKTMVVSFIFLFHTFLLAQNEELYAYRGGNADGFAKESVETLTCQTPFHQFAYFGGNADGAATESLETLACTTPFNQFAYFGGNADGASIDEQTALACNNPYHFFAYFGGIADGTAMGFTADVCPINPPVADFVVSKTTTCIGMSVLFTDTSTNKPTGWNWTFQGGIPATATTKTVNVAYNTPGTYQVQLVATNYIGSDTVTKMGYITVLADCSTLGTSTTGIKPKLQIYPNPTRGIIYIKSPETVQSIEIYDASGRKMKEEKVNTTNASIDLESFSSGMYLMKILTTSGNYIHKVIKQ